MKKRQGVISELADFAVVRHEHPFAHPPLVGKLPELIPRQHAVVDRFHVTCDNGPFGAEGEEKGKGVVAKKRGRGS